MSIVIGVDPDSEAHGVAIYQNGGLVDLKMLPLVELVTLVAGAQGTVLVSIENVMANNYCYQMKLAAGLSSVAKSKIKQNRMMKVGRCQQAQVELQRMLDHYEIPYVLHRPQKGNWADQRDLFQKITGWKGSSNPDTRSAAYFGFLALQK